MSAERGGGALADNFHVLVSCSRVGVGGEGGLSFFCLAIYCFEEGGGL